MKAIETHWKGYRFRSRTEARWAVFLDAAGIRFDYEPEGVVLNGRAYLPDFWLPDARVWLEVKGASPSEVERQLCRDLSAQSGHDCLLAIGPPSTKNPVLMFDNGRREYLEEGFEWIFADDRRNDGWLWLLGLNVPGVSCSLICGNGDDHDRPPMVRSATLNGYEAAASARFEHGESGPAKDEASMLREDGEARRIRYGVIGD